VDKENSATGVPFADSFFVKQRMLLTETADTIVEIAISYEIVFKPGASLQGVLRSAAEKEIQAYESTFLKEIERYLAEVRSRPKHRKSRRSTGESAISHYSNHE
jgi:hypothetical protein